MSVDYALVLTALYPECLWGLNDNDYSTLVWDESNADAMPSQEMLDAAAPQVMFDREMLQVEQARHAAYIASADPEFFRWQRGSGSEGEWLAAVEAVRVAYPYPEVP